MSREAVVVGREEELATIRALFEAPRAGGLVLSGEPGIGKTVLWELGVREAREAGWRVLQHRSVQAEAGLSFAGLSDLIGGVFEEVAEVLVPPRRRALEVALLLAEPGDAPPDSRALGLALLDVLRELARRSPVLLALDDVQWLDASSAAVLAIAVRRLTDEPVVVLATHRVQTGESGTDDPFDGRLGRLELPPLDVRGTHRLVRAALGRDPPRRALAAIHRASGGNPFFALELARAAPEGAGPRELRVPDSLRGLLSARLGRLPAATRDVLLDAAALARPTVELVARDAEALDALDDAVTDGIVALDGSGIRFAHPLLAALTYDRSPPGKRRAVHARLGELVRDPEERARHRALAAGNAQDETLASELEAAGRHAANRGAPGAGAELMELAVRHTPQVDDDARLRRRIATARLHQLAGELEAAGFLYDELMQELPAGPVRAELIYSAALLQRGDAAGHIEMCRKALREAGDDDALAARLLGFIAINRWVGGQLAEGLLEARAGLERAERVGDTRLIASAIARVGVLETVRLDVTPGLLERGVELESRLAEPLNFQDSPSFVMQFRCSMNDQPATSIAMAIEQQAAAERRGDEHTRGWCLMSRVANEYLRGRFAFAIEHAEATLEFADQSGEPLLGVFVSSFAAMTLAHMGRHEELCRTVEAGLILADATGDVGSRVQLRGALGQYELSRGDCAAAHAELDGLCEQLLDIGYLHPGSMPWPDAIEALIGLGELDRAGTLLETYDDLAARSSRWARATAARCRGLYLLATGDRVGAISALERSLAEEGGTYPLERARTFLALGTAHRQALRRRDAREALERAVQLCNEIGAPLWGDRAAAELARVSGRRAQGDGLTQAELRVAELAAQGRQNKEIAATLFLSVGTVEAYLTRAYRKLGVRSRTELANALEPVEHV